MPKPACLSQKKPVGRQPICYKRINRIDPVWCPGRVPPRFWEDEENHRNYLLWLAHKLRFRRMEQWYSVTGKDFIRNHGYTILTYYRSCPSEMLRSLFPEYDWCEWLFPAAPKTFWDSVENQRRFIEWLGHEMGVRCWDDWYRVTERNVKQHGGDGLLTRYDYSLLGILSSLFPEHDWKPWLFGRTPKGFWDQPENRRRYMLWLGEQLGFRKIEDWYRVTSRDFQRHRGSTPLRSRHLGSIPAVLADAFPEYPWDLRRFRKRVTGSGKIIRPPGFWMVRANRVRYLRGLGRQLGFRRPADWYRVTALDLQRHQGFGVLVYYRSCAVRAAMELYPKYPWKEWLFQCVPKDFWNQPENRRRYMHWLGQQLGFRRPADWYRVTGADFDRHRGAQCRSQYGRWPATAVMDLYPKYPWKEWLFPRVPTHFWKRPENQRRYMDWLGEQLGFRQPEDWYRVHQQDFVNNHGGSLLTVYRTLRNLLHNLLPDLDWDKQWSTPRNGNRLAAHTADHKNGATC